MELSISSTVVPPVPHPVKKMLENIKLMRGSADELLVKTDVFIFDCDGVIWKGESLIPGAPYVLDQLRALGKKVLFVTNNSTKSRRNVLSKFHAMGMMEVLLEDIYSSSFAAAAYLEQHPLPAGKKVYVVGMKGICEELALMDIPYIGGPCGNDPTTTTGGGGGRVITLGGSSLRRIDQDPDVAAVVVGMDPAINYYKIQYAQLCIHKNKDCLFIATNLDMVFPTEEDQDWAAGGAMVGAIKGCTNIEPINVGKPAPFLLDYIIAKHKCDDRSRICMVGDNLNTDILFGLDNGLQTVLTLTGVTAIHTLLSDNNKIRPQYYVDSIADFFL